MHTFVWHHFTHLKYLLEVLFKVNTSGDLCELLCVFPLLQHQTQGRLADRGPRGSSRSREQVGIVLGDEAGAHVSSLKLWVVRKAQQKVYVGVQSYDLGTGAQRRTISSAQQSHSTKSVSYIILS